MTTHNINNDWRLDLDETNPAGFRVYRADGKFFEVRFNPAKWGQPLVYEKADANGITGSVVAIVRRHADAWQVAAVRTTRPVDDYSQAQLEGARFSVSNTAPSIAVKADDVRYFPGHTHVNSARIADKTRVGVLDVTDVEAYSLPNGAEWLSFRDFFEQSADMMTKAVLGHFLVERV